MHAGTAATTTGPQWIYLGNLISWQLSELTFIISAAFVFVLYIRPPREAFTSYSNQAERLKLSAKMMHLADIKMLQPLELLS